ncbi:caspase family protein, partial [Streptomyces sp. NBC_00236]
CASDFDSEHDGLSLADIMGYANRSPAKNKVIILDSCHSGAAGGSAVSAKVAEISEGVTILTASAANQYAIETGGSGVFTSLFVDALSGSAANLVGEVTPGSVYAHVDQSLGPWSQRPIFKTNVKEFVSLRKADAPIELEKLQKLVELFQEPTTLLQLDPSYEPERTGAEDPSFPAPDPVKNADFAVLQALVRVNLVRPVSAPHMWHAAMNSKTCELTVLGQHYWSLVKQELI